MKHRIVIRCEGRSLRDFALKQQISKCITAALAHQGVNTPCAVSYTHLTLPTNSLV